MNATLYPDMKGSDHIQETCGRCGGSGVYNAPSRIAWDNGNGSTTWCFECHGAGHTSILVSSVRARARREAKRAEEAAAQAAEFAVALAGWKADYEPLVLEANAVIIAGRPGNPLIRTLADAVEQIEYPQTATAEGAVKVHEALAAITVAAEAPQVLPLGRVQIAGEIVGKKLVDHQYGSTLKILIQGDGWKVWGTAPRSIGYEDLVGMNVKFTATVVASDDDQNFGFYSRPTKAQVL